MESPEKYMNFGSSQSKRNWLQEVRGGARGGGHGSGDMNDVLIYVKGLKCKITLSGCKFPYIFSQGIYIREFNFLNNVKEALANPNDYETFMEYLYHYSTEIFTTNELEILVTALLGKYPDLMEGFKEFMARCENIDGHLAGLMSKIERAKGAHINDKYRKNHTKVDLSKCESCTPSYRLLPDNYQIPASRRLDFDTKVLNEQCASVTSGSEDHFARQKRRNRYQEILLKCEDDRFEMDMLLECVASTSKHAEEFLKRFDNNSIGLRIPIKVEEHFTTQNLRCIKHLYGDHGMYVMDTLRESPVATLNVILDRLKQKQKELTKILGDLNKIWLEIYAKCFYKSMDHRSLYFKQQDLKKLSKKSLLADLLEDKESKQKEYDFILPIAAGKKRCFILTLEFENFDNDIHEDLYKLIRYSCLKVCSTEQDFNKVTKLLITFIEQVLGVASRPYHKSSPLKSGIATKTGHDQLPPSEGGDVIKSSLLKLEFEDQVLADVAVGECFKLKAKPLAKHVPILLGVKEKKDSRVFYGNDDFYVLFRLHKILYDRILSAKMDCIAAEKKGTTSKDSSSTNLYARFMGALYSWLDFPFNNEKFEDECRALIGNQSYKFFTLDKLINKLSKQLQTVATDEMANKLVQLYKYEESRRPESFTDVVYLDNARLFLQNENIYRFEFLSSPSRLTIELKEVKGEKHNAGLGSVDPNFMVYLKEDYLAVHLSEREPRGIMLRRNKSKYANLDELTALKMAMKDVQMVNGLEYKLTCGTSKIWYTAYTEDFFYRKKKRKQIKTPCVNIQFL